jgi:hypothetical protein
MSLRFDHAVRTAVRDLADEGHPVNLARPAIRQGRRIVVRRRAVTVAAAVAVAAALVVPFVVNRGPDRRLQRDVATQPSSSPAPSPALTHPAGDFTKGPITLVEPWIVAAAPADGGSWVFDRTAGRYKTVPYDRINPAPAGDLAAVHSGSKLGLLNVHTGALRWVSGPASAVGVADWSADGTRLVYPANGTASQSLRLAVVDAATAKATIIGGNLECYENCAPAWLPNGQEIALAAPDQPGRVVVYSASTGQPTRQLQLPGAIPALHSWSPDGRLVVTRAGAQAALFEIGSGRTLLTLDDYAGGIYPIDGDRLLCVRSDGFVLLDHTGTTLAVFPRPAGLADNELNATVLAKR